jgi:hypothetical protein
MADPTHITNAQRRKRERRVWRMGLMVSAFVHALILLLWPVQSILISPFAAAGPRASDALAASGAMQALNLRMATEVTPVFVERPVPIPIEVEVEPVEFEEEPTIEAMVDPGRGQGTQGPGTTEGPGTTDGTGAGDGGTSDEGRFRLIPPTPRGMIIPPSSDRLRGREVEVWVFVDERGRVVADSTRLQPPTSDGNFNRQLIREAAEWIFRPAMQGGSPVATWFPYRISM